MSLNLKFPVYTNWKQETGKRCALISYRAVKDTGPGVHWVHSFVSNGRTHCVYIADNEELVREHANLAEVPVTRIYEVDYVLEPTHSEGH